eukprot:gene446-biopygen19624
MTENSGFCSRGKVEESGGMATWRGNDGKLTLVRADRPGRAGQADKPGRAGRADRSGHTGQPPKPRYSAHSTHPTHGAHGAHPTRSIQTVHIVHCTVAATPPHTRERRGGQHGGEQLREIHRRHQPPLPRQGCPAERATAAFLFESQATVEQSVPERPCTRHIKKGSEGTSPLVSRCCRSPSAGRRCQFPGNGSHLRTGNHDRNIPMASTGRKPIPPVA